MLWIFYANKSNLNEVGKFLKRNKLPTLTEKNLVVWKALYLSKKLNLRFKTFNTHTNPKTK